MPQLSIITINLNNAAGLQTTIESVIRQTSQDFEYIVIDGGSTDGSVEVIKRYAANITYWVSETDKGIYAAMNKGIRIAKGQYCQFLNSGDWLWKDDVTDRMLLSLPDAAIVYGNKIRAYKGRQKVEKSYQGRRLTLLDMYQSTLFHSCAYIRRSLFDKYGLYDENLKIVSDWKFYLIAIGLHNESVAYQDIDMVWFDSNGISSTHKSLDQQERKQVLQAILPDSIRYDYEKFSTDSQIIRRFKETKIIWFFILNLYRILFRTDKIRNK